MIFMLVTFDEIVSNHIASYWEIVKSYYVTICNKIVFIYRCIYPHPDTAAENSIEDGDWVYIETKRGRVKRKAFLSESLHPRVVCADSGWWFPEEAKYELHGWKTSNINIIIDDRFQDSPETGSLNLRGLLCRVYKVGNN
jgi:anaerobic selenocysteine-containing dehydrogenase